jgi:hypothetical protein
MVKRFVAEFPREQILCAGSKLAIRVMRKCSHGLLAIDRRRVAIESNQRRWRG